MGQSVFITGTDYGLGYSLVERWAMEGFEVFAGHRLDGVSLRPLIDRFPGKIHLVPQDVTDRESIQRSVELVREKTDSLDMLINCAGICSPDQLARLETVQLYDGWLEKVMAVNAFGPLRVTQAMLPLLKAGQLKRIIVISSEAGSIGQNWREHGYGYCMSKSAVNMFSQIAQRALRNEGFRFLIIHPGWLQTPMSGAGKGEVAPHASAEGIYRLSQRQSSSDDPIYMDYTGKLFNW